MIPSKVKKQYYVHINAQQSQLCHYIYIDFLVKVIM